MLTGVVEVGLFCRMAKAGYFGEVVSGVSAFCCFAVLALYPALLTPGIGT